MAKKHNTVSTAPENISPVEEKLPWEQQPEEATEETDVQFNGAFNGNSLSFGVSRLPKQPSELVVELDEKLWARVPLQAPLTVVRGYQLPGTYRLNFYVQPINF